MKLDTLLKNFFLYLRKKNLKLKKQRLMKLNMKVTGLVIYDVQDQDGRNLGQLVLSENSGVAII